MTNDTTTTNNESPASELTMHPEPQGSEVFINAIQDLKTHFHMTYDNALTGVLWVAHAHMFDAFEFTPRLAITAPLKACGKSRYLEVLSLMTDQSVRSGRVSPASFVRLCGRGNLSFFLDEADMLFGKYGGNAEMITALNAGYESGGNFWKCIEPANVPTQMPVHSGVAMAGISLNNKLPDTTLSRCIVINMERARAGQLQEKYRRKRHEHKFITHGEKIKRWIHDHREVIENHDPQIPDVVDERDEDKWFPLLAIAQIASPQLGQQAMRMLMDTRVIEDDEAKMRLLKDWKSIYATHLPTLSSELHRGMSSKGIQPNTLAIQLCQVRGDEFDEDNVWSRWNSGKPNGQDATIKGYQVTRLLQEFGIQKVSIRHDHGVFNGYKWEHMEKACDQWLNQSEPEYEAGEDWAECSHVVSYTTTGGQA